MVLFVEERVTSGELDHMKGMFSGFMNDGQVEQPVERRRGRGSFVKRELLKKETTHRGKWFQSYKREQRLHSGAFRNSGVLSGYFHQLWLDTSDALSVPGIGPGTFLNAQSGL